MPHNVAVNERAAKRWLISGRVQGVGFRDFAYRRATQLGLSGWTRNLADGRVEVYAVGADDALNRLGAMLHMGPRMADVRHVEEQPAPVDEVSGFEVR